MRVLRTFSLLSIDFQVTLAVESPLRCRTLLPHTHISWRNFVYRLQGLPFLVIALVVISPSPSSATFLNTERIWVCHGQDASGFGVRGLMYTERWTRRISR